MNGWVNNREAGDLRHHRAHYDITLVDVSNPNIDGWGRLLDLVSFLRRLMNGDTYFENASVRKCRSIYISYLDLKYAKMLKIEYDVRMVDTLLTGRW